MIMCLLAVKRRKGIHVCLTFSCGMLLCYVPLASNEFRWYDCLVESFPTGITVGEVMNAIRRYILRTPLLLTMQEERRNVERIFINSGNYNVEIRE